MKIAAAIKVLINEMQQHSRSLSSKASQLLHRGVLGLSAHCQPKLLASMLAMSCVFMQLCSEI
jgi:hypothetical protein